MTGKREIDTILFDLDGTLLPMDTETFSAAYFRALAAKAAPFGYDAQSIVDAVWTATRAMMKNDGAMTNAERFWSVFPQALGEEAAAQLKMPFDGFYREEFHSVRQATMANPNARKLVDSLKKQGYTLVVATNPLFPLDGNLTRMSWVDLYPEDFQLITSYETAHYCKPNLGYYREMLSNLGKEPQNCIMVGNDATEDLAVNQLGMESYLVTDCLLNPHQLDLTGQRQGSFQEMMDFFADLPVRWDASAGK